MPKLARASHSFEATLTPRDYLIILEKGSATPQMVRRVDAAREREKREQRPLPTPPKRGSPASGTKRASVSPSHTHCLLRCAPARPFLDGLLVLRSETPYQKTNTRTLYSPVLCCSCCQSLFHHLFKSPYPGFCTASLYHVSGESTFFLWPIIPLCAFFNFMA